jgi:molybdate transport system substrate-binding protein
MKRMSCALRAAFAVLLWAGAAQAAEIKVISSNGLTAVLDALKPKYEKATGNRLVIHYDVANVLKKNIMDGEAFDLAILTGPVMDEMVQAGKVRPTTRAEIARSGSGIAYKAGSPRPDIHDAESFKAAMLAAKSIAYTTQGASGLYFISVCEKLGIADEVKAKSKVLPGGRVAELVARGEAELAAQQISELLPVAGVQVIAFPPELQKFTSFPGAVGTASKRPKAAAALIKFLTGRTNAALIRAKGMEPG